MTSSRCGFARGDMLPVHLLAVAVPVKPDQMSALISVERLDGCQETFLGVLADRGTHGVVNTLRPPGFLERRQDQFLVVSRHAIALDDFALIAKLPAKRVPLRSDAVACRDRVSDVSDFGGGRFAAVKR